MKSVKVTSLDSTCFSASYSAGHFNANIDAIKGFVAIPDCYEKVSEVTKVAAKHDEYVWLDFADGESKKKIICLWGMTPEEALKEATEWFLEEGLDEEDLKSWENV